MDSVVAVYIAWRQKVEDNFQLFMANSYDLSILKFDGYRLYACIKTNGGDTLCNRTMA